jgi:geranylgeranyl reductase family protein
MTDVIIVGAGPAGSFCAIKLAQLGIKATILEKKHLPRKKVCGGGVSYKAIKLLESVNVKIPSELVAGKVIGFDFYNTKGLIFGTPVGDYDYGITTWREKFDEYLAMHAKKEGAILITGENVIKINAHSESVTVFTESGNQYDAKIIIGADGIMGVTRQYLNGKLKLKESGFAYEEFIPKKIIESKIPDVRCKIYYTKIPFGFAWVFEKRDGYSIGLGGRADKTKTMKYEFGKFVSVFIKDYKDVVRFEDHKTNGWYMPAGGHKRKIVSDRILAIGDAAEFCDSLTGEGIFYAFKSAEFAAEITKKAIEKNQFDSNFLSTYYYKCKDSFFKHLKFSKWFCIINTYWTRVFGDKYPLIKYTRQENSEAALKLSQGTIDYTEYWEIIKDKVLRKIGIKSK